MPFYQRRILPERLSERSDETVNYDNFTDLNNQYLSNVIRQLSSLASFADEILGDSQGVITSQNDRIRTIGLRIDHLHQRVQSLNPKASVRLQNGGKSRENGFPSMVYQSPSHLEKRLFMQKNRPQSVVRLQSGIDLDDDDSIEFRQGRMSSRLVRPRSLESDLLLLPLPNGQSRSTSPTIPLPNMSSLDDASKNDLTVPNRFLKRTSTTATCAVSPRMHESDLRNLSDTSTSPERDKALGYDLHGFQDSRLALVRRSMIARRTQARLREKRRRNRTVALSPEDDRRSSFISTFLADTKLLHDQGVQVPSQTSTLSNKDEDEIVDAVVVKRPTSDFENIHKQMERQDTSSGCWSGGSTIQTVSDLQTPYALIQELNDQNLQRHNSQMQRIESKSNYRTRINIISRSDCDESDQISSADSGASSKARLTPCSVPPPTPPTRTDSIKRDATSQGRPDSIYLDENNKLLKQSDFEYPAPLVLTPSEASESGICSNSEFQFPSPPKKTTLLDSVSGGVTPVKAPITPVKAPFTPVKASFTPVKAPITPVKAPIARDEIPALSMQDELQRKLSHRLSKIERIEAGEEQAFEKELIPSDNLPSETTKINGDHATKKAEDEPVQPSITTDLPGDSDSTPLPQVDDKGLEFADEMEEEVFEDAAPSIVTPRLSLNTENSSPLSSPQRSSSTSAIISSSYRLQQNLATRGRNDSRRSNKTLSKTNSSNFKSLLLRSMTSNDKSVRVSAAERLKVAPGQTLQDLYKPRSSDSSPARCSDNLPNSDFSPGKRRNKSKHRFSSMHRLTSIVEEKDIVAAKEMFKGMEITNGNVERDTAESSPIPSVQLVA